MSINKYIKFFGIVLVAIAAGGAVKLPAVWTDPSTGVAIGGYDPMAYYTHGQPKVGLADFELFWEGATWRFYNHGNLEEFRAHGAEYAPVFAGYDPVSLAKKRYMRGAPSLWDIYEGKLLLFGTKENLRAWREDGKGIMEVAQKNWREMSELLTDYRAKDPLGDLYPKYRR